MGWIIRVIYRFLLGILRLFWRLIWTLILLILITFGILWYVTGDLPATLNQVSKVVQVGQAGWQQWQETGELQGLSQTDNHQHSGAKWAKAQATIYIDPQMDTTFQKPTVKPLQTGIRQGLLTLSL